METLYSTSGFNSDASLSGRPHTPPYTPARVMKRRLERSGSPASTVNSVHPTDTVSPAKKAAKRATEDQVIIQELEEGDPGYTADLDVVYPEELEEVDSSDRESDSSSTASDVSDVETKGLTRRLSRLRCGDDRDVHFEETRRRKQKEKRLSVRSYKRSHSQSVKSEIEATDIDARDDHDLKSSTRRLRRKVEGSPEGSIASDGLPRSSPEIASAGASRPHVDENTLPSEEFEMDVDHPR